jgi:hypothetical protein
VAPERGEISLPAGPLELQECSMHVPLGKSAGAPGPGLDVGPVPRGLTGNGPTRRWQEAALAPRVHGLWPHGEANGDLSRPHRLRFTWPTSDPTPHQSSVMCCVTTVKINASGKTLPERAG